MVSKPKIVSRMQERYLKEVLPALKKNLGRTNPHDLPRLQKIVVNMGVGSAVTEKKPLATFTFCASVQPDGPPRIVKVIAKLPLRGCPVALVSRPW